MGFPLDVPLGEEECLVLASASPRRRELLARLGLDFDVHPAQVEEWEADSVDDPGKLVSHNARLKALALMETFAPRPILAADTTVALGRELLHKPADMAEARQMLTRLCGQSHTVYTAVVLNWRARAHEDVRIVTSRVTFRPFEAARLEAYLRLVNPLDKAGAYGIQEGRGLMIECWEGSFSNIMGLPIKTVAEMLQTVGLKVKAPLADEADLLAPDPHPPEPVA